MIKLDIREIFTLAWDYPLCTGGLALMFTTPMFRVIVFFSPLLICTAVCAVALISVGQHIEAAREREIPGWSAKIADGGDLSAGLGSATGQRNVSPGKDSWLKLVQGPEPAVSASNYETERSNWISNSAKFGSATGPRNVGPGEDSWLKLVQGFEPVVSASNNETEKSNWMGIVNKEEGLKKHAYRVAEGMQFLGEQEHLDRQIEALREYEKKFRETTRAKAIADGASATVEAWKARASPGIRSSPSAGIVSAPQERNSNCDMPARKVPPMVLYNLRTGGTGRATMNSGGVGAAALSSWASGAPAAVTGSQKEAIVAEGLSHDSFDRFSRNDNVLESSLGKRGTEPLLPLPRQKPTSVSEADTIVTTPVADMQASPFATVKNMNHNAPTKNVAWPASIMPDHRLEGELATFTSKAFGGKEKNSHKTSVFAPQGPGIISSCVKSPANRSEESHRTLTGKESRRSLSAPRSPLNNLTRVASPAKSPAKHSLDRTLKRAATHNSSSRSGNAVIYNAGSESNVVSVRRKGCGTVPRN